MVKRSTFWLAAALTAIGTAANAQSMPAGMAVDHGKAAPAASTTAPPGYDDAMKASMSSMSGMMAAKPTGMPDRDFVAMMLPHHQGAVEMAKVQLRFGKDPELRKLARSIIKDQEREIAFMKRWQARHAER